METWFLNQVLCVSLSVLLLGLPGPLGAGTPTINITDPVTAGLYYSTATDELGNMESSETSTSHSSESLSPSQRNILLTHTETHTAAAAGHLDTEQTQTFTETSSRSLEDIIQSTEPLTSTLVVATTETSTGSGSSSSSGSSSGTSGRGSGRGGGSSGSSDSTSGSTSGSSDSTSGSSDSTSGSSDSTSSSSGSTSGSSSTSGSTSGRGSGSTSGSIRGSTTSGSSGSSSGSTSGSTSGSIRGSTSGRGSGSSSGSTSGSSSGSTSGSSSGSTSGRGSGSTSGSTSGSSGSTSGSSSGSTSTRGSTSGSTRGSTSGSTSGSSSGTSGSTRGSTSGSSSGSTSSGSGSGSSSGSGSGSTSTSGSTTSGSGSSSGSGSTSTSTSGSTSSGSGSGSSSGSGSTSTSTSSGSSSSSRDWKDITNTDQVSDASPAVSWEVSPWMSTEEDRLPQDSPDTTLRLGDASALTSHAAVHTDSTYTSTTISRAGERTLLSVTSSSSNSTSSASTEDSKSTWGISAGATETEYYTHSAPSTRTDSRDTTDQHMTPSFKGPYPETGSTGGSRGTQSLTGQPNATHHQYTSTSEETSDSTPPLRVTEPSTDQSEVSVSSIPTVTSPAQGPTNISGTEQGSGSSVTTFTESTAGAHGSSTQNQEGTEGVSSQTLGLTTATPTVSRSTSEVDDSLTDTPVPVTEVFLTTTPVTVTERSQITEEDTFKATVSTTNPTTPALIPATSSSAFSSSAGSSTPRSPTEATIARTTSSSTSSTLALLTSAAHPTRRVTPTRTQEPSTWTANPTDATTLQAETSTPGIATTHSQRVTTTTTTTHGAPTKSTAPLQTTGRQTERATTEPVGTTSPTKAPTPPRTPGNPCVSNPCMNGGMCVSYKGHQFTCHCQQAWTGPTCNQDVDECERDPCPVGSRCVNTRGSFGCECPLGFDLEDGRTCTRAKAFLGTFSVNRLPHDPVIFKSATMHEIQRELVQLLNASLSVLRGYSRSTLSKKGEDGLRISAVNMFSITTDVTVAEVYNSIQMSLSNCSSSMAHCRMVLHHQLTYHVESLCVAQKTQCDTERSTCTDNSGTADCQCLQGYYKHNPEDLSCLECGDGYKLENGTCVPCMFGFGGFNCGNFYKLIAIVVSPAGGALLLIFIIALIVTCCKKDKNDINKIIFKSGDLQMSPYADFPKNNRISTEWGRETIEMQENGSTKNLLQMTDIYYSPALRNSDLERNGLYPFTGLPGSRHSCIYPAQWNPSFISDDSRRRDYF